MKFHPQPTQVRHAKRPCQLKAPTEAYHQSNYMYCFDSEAGGVHFEKASQSPHMPAQACIGGSLQRSCPTEKLPEADTRAHDKARVELLTSPGSYGSNSPLYFSHLHVVHGQAVTTHSARMFLMSFKISSGYAAGCMGGGFWPCPCTLVPNRPSF